MQLLRIDWNVIFTIVNLIVLYLALRKFLIGPVMNIMEQRKHMIAGQISEAHRTTVQANELKTQYEEMLKVAHEESDRIMENARKSAQMEYDSKMDAAKADAQKVIANAQRTIELEREKTMQELEGQIASLAMVAAGKVLAETESAAGNQLMYEQFLAKTGGLNDANSK